MQGVGRIRHRTGGDRIRTSVGTERCIEAGPQATTGCTGLGLRLAQGRLRGRNGRTVGQRLLDAPVQFIVAEQHPPLAWDFRILQEGLGISGGTVRGSRLPGQRIGTIAGLGLQGR